MWLKKNEGTILDSKKINISSNVMKKKLILHIQIFYLLFVFQALYDYNLRCRCKIEYTSRCDYWSLRQQKFMVGF